MTDINDPSSMPVDGEPAPSEVPPVTPPVPDSTGRSNHADQRVVVVVVAVVVVVVVVVVLIILETEFVF